MHILKEEDEDNCKIQMFIVKLIDYDKIYAIENIDKNNKKMNMLLIFKKKIILEMINLLLN